MTRVHIPANLDASLFTFYNNIFIEVVHLLNKKRSIHFLALLLLQIYFTLFLL